MVLPGSISKQTVNLHGNHGTALLSRPAETNNSTEGWTQETEEEAKQTHDEAVAETRYCYEEAIVLPGQAAKQTANFHGNHSVAILSQPAGTNTSPKGRMQEAEEAAKQQHGEPNDTLYSTSVASLQDTIRARAQVSKAILAEVYPQQSFVAPTPRGPDGAVDKTTAALIIALATPTQTES